MTERSRFALVLAAVLAVAFLRFVETGSGSIDDAFILLIYVRHFVAGGGFYYNLGDGRVDGFTSPLDLAVKSAAVALWPRDPILVCWAVTLAFHLATAAIALAIGVKLARATVAPRPLALGALVGLLVASSPPLAEGSAFLLETPLACALALAAVALVRWPPRTVVGQLGAGVVIAALPLARPEALPLALALLALLVWRARAWPSLIALALYAAYALWHRRYFGAWAPNTYYAKSSDSRLWELRDGIGYVAAYALTPGLPLLAVAIAPPLIARFGRFRPGEARRDALAAGALAWLGLASAIWAGGDCYAGGRFLALPLTLAPLALAALLVGGDGRTRTLAQIAAGVTLAVQLAVAIAIPSYLAITERAAMRRWLHDYLPLRAASFDCARRASERIGALFAGGVVAQTDDQQLKYFADALTVRDLTGLNDRAIAHRPAPGPVRWGKLDLVAAVEERPDAIVLGHRIEPHPRALADHPLAETFRRAELRDSFFGYGVAPEIADAIVARYRPASLRVCDGWFNFLVRADRARDEPDLRVGAAQ